MSWRSHDSKLKIASVAVIVLMLTVTILVPMPGVGVASAKPMFATQCFWLDYLDNPYQGYEFGSCPIENGVYLANGPHIDLDLSALDNWAFSTFAHVEMYCEGFDLVAQYDINAGHVHIQVGYTSESGPPGNFGWVDQVWGEDYTEDLSPSYGWCDNQYAWGDWDEYTAP